MGTRRSNLKKNAENVYIDVVIPVYGALHHLKRALDSLVDQPAQVYVIDDRGPEDAEVLCRDYANVIYYRNKKNLGFAEACNTGARMCQSPYILFMNSDVEAFPGSMETFVTEFAERSVGIVGGLLVFPLDHPDPRARGMVQHAGMVWNLDKIPYHRFITWHPTHPRVQQRQQVQTVTGAWLAIRRQLFFSVGGFRKEYGRGTYEDTDLCMSVQEKGYKVMYSPYPVGFHYANGSNQPFDLGLNQQIFLQRHGPNVVWDEWMIL